MQQYRHPRFDFTGRESTNLPSLNGFQECTMELKPTLDQAFNSASIGIISADQFGNIAAVNRQASEIIGIKKQKRSLHSVVKSIFPGFGANQLQFSQNVRCLCYYLFILLTAKEKGGKFPPCVLDLFKIYIAYSSNTIIIARIG
jgi:PAS domain-containing protein